MCSGRDGTCYTREVIAITQDQCEAQPIKIQYGVGGAHDPSTLDKELLEADDF